MLLPRGIRNNNPLNIRRSIDYFAMLRGWELLQLG